MKNVTPQSALNAVVDAARAAGKIMRTNWHRPKRVNSAEAHDIKLELDVRCQKLIQQRLRRKFPAIPLLGEKGAFRRQIDARIAGRIHRLIHG